MKPKRPDRKRGRLWARGYRQTPKPPPVVLHTRPDGSSYRILTRELATYWLNIWAAKKTLERG